MMAVEILQVMYQKGLNQLDFLWFFKLCCIQPVFLRIKDVASNTLLRTFLKIKILAAEGFKLSACLPPYPTHYCIFGSEHCLQELQVVYLATDKLLVVFHGYAGKVLQPHLDHLLLPPGAIGAPWPSFLGGRGIWGGHGGTGAALGGGGCGGELVAAEGPLLLGGAGGGGQLPDPHHLLDFICLHDQFWYGMSCNWII